MPDTASASVSVAPLDVLAALGFDGAERITPVTGGEDTLIWRVERGGESFALRVFRADQVEPAMREARAMRAAAAVIPVPLIIAQGTWQGRPAVLLEWCRGWPLMDILVAHPDRVGVLGREVGRLQAQIHTLPPVEPDTVPVVLGYLRRVDPALAERLEAALSNERRLLHLDFHPMNVLADGERITAVIDWVNTLSGDPRLDAARTVTILRLTPLPPQARALVTPQFRRQLERAWRQGYEAAGGMLTEMPIFYAAAGVFMLNELMPRAANPTHWLQPEQLEPVRRWVRYWRTCAGVR